MSTPTARNGGTSPQLTSGEVFIANMMGLSADDRIAKLASTTPTALTAAIVTRTLLENTSNRVSLLAVREKLIAHFTRSSPEDVAEVFRWSIRYVNTSVGGLQLWAHQEMSAYLHLMLAGTSYRRYVLTSAGGELLYTAFGNCVIDIEGGTRRRMQLMPRDVILFSMDDVEYPPDSRRRRHGKLSKLVLLDPCDPRNDAARV